MQHSGRPSFPTSANCCSPRKKAEGGIKEGEAKKEKCQGRRTPLHVRSLDGEDYLVLCQLCPGFLFPPVFSPTTGRGVGGQKSKLYPKLFCTRPFQKKSAIMPLVFLLGCGRDALLILYFSKSEAGRGEP